MGLRFLRWMLPASLAGLAILLGGCGSNPPPYNQTPAITGMVPSNITAGSQDFTVFISGTGFISSAKKGVSFAYWNGSPRSTSYNITTSQLQMTVLASDVAAPGQAQITVVNPPPGGGKSLAAVTFYVEPVATGGPTITSIDPTSAQVNTKTPPLITITGTNFSVNDVVTWNGQPRAATSTYTDQNHMTIQPAPTDLAAVGTASISVAEPGLVMAAPSVNFSITSSSNPSPTVSSLSPSSATAGSPDLEVLVTGKIFVPNSQVLWNSMPVPTAYLSATQMMALIPTADLASAGSADVSVMNPAPGGGTSSTTPFTIN